MRFAILPTMVTNLFMKSPTYFSNVIFLTFRTFNKIDWIMFMVELCFVFNWKLEPSFVPVYTTFVSLLFGGDLCKVVLKDLRPLSSSCPFYGNVMNDNFFSDIWLLFLFVTLFSLLVLLSSLLLLLLTFLSCCFSTCVNICFITQRG